MPGHPTGSPSWTAIVPRAELEATVMGYKRLAGFDPETLNRRESWSVPAGA